MSTRRFSRARGFLLAALFTVSGSNSVSADSLTLSDVLVEFDAATLSASVSAGLQAHSDSGSDVFLDGLSVSLFEEGVPIDLTAGPILLDDGPFFANTPPFLADGGLLPPVVLFRLLPLTPGASYSLSFLLFQGGAPLVVSPDLGFVAPQDPSAAPVPEPTTLSLVALGVAGLWGGVRRRRTERRVPRG